MTRRSGELPPGEAAKLHSLVDYRPGSVVSRALVQSEIGSLTLFAFDKGQGLSEHTAPYDAHVQILDGAAHITVGGRPVDAFKGEIVRLPANVPHALEARRRFKMLLTMIREKKGGG
ncbi:MAG: cupin domain-containing protein [Planctomycetes bacterium]|nr:cupin domain-containing protein [Planctomycetota bacterium]